MRLIIKETQMKSRLLPIPDNPNRIALLYEVSILDGLLNVIALPVEYF